MAEVESGATKQQSSQQLKKQKSKKERKRDDSKSSSLDDEAELITGRVIAEHEIGHFVDLGLGRGVDATKSSPWLSKSSFQVREVSADNIIGTEEGGLVNNFEEVVESVQQLQTSMSASVPASQQVSVGVDSELSRSYSKTKRSVGTRVLTRTISFRADFDDICVRRRKKKGGRHQLLPQRAITLPEGEAAIAEAEATLIRSQSEEHQPTFEERLSNWVLEHLDKVPSMDLDKLVNDGEDANPIDKMNALIDSKIVKRKDLRPLCHDFVTATSITHYVCAIELGAASYKVMSEEEVQTQLKTKGKIGVSSAADVSVSQQAKWYKKNRQKQGTKIGVYGKDKKVERGTTGEAVVGVKFQPLSSVVVRCNMLKKALEAALQNYIDSQGIAKYGPFYISCHSEQLFFQVDDNNKVSVTDDVSKASAFFVVPCEEEGRRHFSIFFNSETKLKLPQDTRPKMRIKPIPRYLCASVNFRGICDGPLEMKLNAKESKSMLVLHDRRSKHLQPVELTDWVNGKEIFYINCKHRSFKKDSYISVTGRRQSPSIAQSGTAMEGGETAEGEVAEASRNGTTTGEGKEHRYYTTCCKPNISAHNDQNTFMLFRLIRVKQTINWNEDDEQEKSDTDTNNGLKSASTNGRKQGSGGGGEGGGGGGGGSGGGGGGKEKQQQVTINH